MILKEIRYDVASFDLVEIIFCEFTILSLE